MTRQRSILPDATHVAWTAIVAIAYVAAAMAGFALAFGTKQVTAIWPPTGIALAAMLLRGPRIWPGVFIGAFVSNATGNEPLLTAATIAVGNTAGPLLGAHLLRRVIDMDLGLGQVRDILGLTLFGSALAMIITATNGVMNLALAGIISWTAAPSVWALWWVGDAMGALLVAPAILTWFAEPRRRWLTARRGELLTALITLILVSMLSFSTHLPLAYPIFPVVFWVALRFGQRETASAILIVSTVAVWQTIHGHGPFTSGSPDWRLSLLVTFMAVLAITSLTLGALASERRRAEASLRSANDELEARAIARRSDALFRLVTEHATDAVLTLDASGRVRYISSPSERLLGFAAANILGHAFDEFVHADDQSQFIFEFGAAELKRQIIFRCVRGDGGVVWVEADFQAITDSEQGGATEIIGILRDITDRTTAEERLRESEMRFRGAFDTAAHGMALVSPDGRWLRVNAALCKMLGYDDEELLALDFQAMTHPEDLDIDLVHVRRLLAGEAETYQMEKRYHHKEGRTVWVLLSVSLVRTSDGQPLHFVSQIQNITDRKIAEDGLRASEAQLSLLAENATDTVFRIELNGTCVYASPSIRDLMGIEPEFSVGQNFFSWVHADDAPYFCKVHQALVSGEDERAVVTYRIAPAHRPGTWAWLEAHCGIVHDPVTNVPLEIIASVRDISERKALELELELARAHAEEGAAAKSNFLAHMSHEIRTPMNGVLGFTQLLLDGNLSDSQRRFAQLISDSGHAMMHLLDDILDISKVEAGEMSIERDAIDLREIVQSCVKLISPGAVNKGLDIRFDIALSIPDRIWGDGMRLRQILLNLLSNAVKFTSEGFVTLTATKSPEEPAKLEIAIEDTGFGIAPDRLSAIFRPFQQADQSTARRFGGSGLGLSISDQLARLMGGELRVESREGDGSIFILSLPLEAADETVALAGRCDLREETSSNAKEYRGNILLAEDHEINQILVKEMLAKLHYRVEIAADGAEAIDRIENAAAAGRQYDLALMDVQMPNIDGLDATRTIRSRGISPNDLPIIALTAHAYADDIEQCLDAGMQAHIAKPISLRELESVLLRWKRGDAPAETDDAPALSLRKRYDSWKASALGDLHAMAERATFTDSEMRNMADMLHKLAGTAGMFGEAGLAAQARDLEDGIARSNPEERSVHVRSAIGLLARAPEITKGWHI